jgi:hypothetical protein
MMTIGTENKRATAVAGVLLVLAGLLLYRGLRTPSEKLPVREASSAPASSTAKARPRSTRGYVGFLLEPTLDPHLRVDLLAQSEGTAYEGSGRDIFSDHDDDIPQPVAPGLMASSDAPPAWPLAPAPPPTPPAMNLEFWGWVSVPGESKAVFLAQGENGFVAHEGDIVARRYKVEKIGSRSVEVEDMLSNYRESIPVTF